MMKKIIFVQAKLPHESRALQQITNRWSTYGEMLQRKDSRFGIWIFTPNPLNVETRDLITASFLNFFPKVEEHKNPILRLRSLQRELSSGKEPVTLVCGDNQQSLVIALILKITLKDSSRIQIQFHGDIYTFRASSGVRGFMRVCLSRLGIHFADSIRIVSKFQAEEIIQISKSSELKLVLAPIPIDFSRVAKVSAVSKFDVIFVGRLHPERGITELIQVIKSLQISRPGTTVAIVGDGPLRKKISIELEPWITNSTVSILGFLTGEEIQNIYSSANVLISTAPREGYGLTLREAALSNVRVVARESKGAAEAQKSFPTGFETYSGIDQAVPLIQASLEKPKRRISTEILSSQSKSDASGVNRLIESWLIH
jgi:glycosyltransferase involved in cell wall biosynthesis